MTGRTLQRSIFLLALLAGAAPFLATLYVAHDRAMRVEIQRAQEIARDVLARTEVLATQATEIERQILSYSHVNPCDDEMIAVYASLAIRSRYVELIGHAEGDRLICSGLGPHHGGLSLGPVDYVSSNGVDIRQSVALDIAPGQGFASFQRGSVVLILRADLPIDLLLADARISVGILNRSLKKPLSSRGEARPDQLALDIEQPVYFDGRFLRVLEHSEVFDITTYAAMPEAYLKQELNGLALVLAPIGLALGLALASALLWIIRRQQSLPALLRAALRNSEFSLHYQPIVNLRSGELTGVEALIRWPKGKSLKLEPELFIPAAEECGLIGGITRCVLEQVANDAPRLLSVFPDAVISINLAAEDLSSASTVQLLEGLTDVPGIEAKNIAVEVTEHSLIRTETALEVIRHIRARGMKVAIDDFGTGFSGLSNLTELPLDALKIDRTFVTALGNHPASHEVLLHVIAIAKSLGLTIIAEGVETEAQEDFLRANGVHRGQGWLYGGAEPMNTLIRSVHSNGTEPKS